MALINCVGTEKEIKYSPILCRAKQSGAPFMVYDNGEVAWNQSTNTTQTCTAGRITLSGITNANGDLALTATATVAGTYYDKDYVIIEHKNANESMSLSTYTTLPRDTSGAYFFLAD